MVIIIEFADEKARRMSLNSVIPTAPVKETEAPLDYIYDESGGIIGSTPKRRDQSNA